MYRAHGKGKKPSMSAFDILQRWLQPLLDPLNEVRGVIQQPLSIHQEAVSTFATLVAGLYEGPDGFEGDAADAVKATTESYLHAEAQFSGAGSTATGTFAAAAVLTLPTTTTDTVLEDAAIRVSNALWKLRMLQPRLQLKWAQMQDWTR